MKKVTFYYVRHGQTLFNVQNRMQGWCDSPLTENGILDAKKAHDILKDIPFDAAYTSTSERCRDTLALVLGERNVPVFETKGLKEINFGTYEAVDQDEFFEEIKDRRMNLDWADCGGDDKDSFFQRIRTTFEKIYADSDDGDHILIVSHGAVWLWSQEILFGIDKEQFRKAKEEKGLPMMPNGYNGCFECVDGTFVLKEIPGLDDADIRRIYEDKYD